MERERLVRDMKLKGQNHKQLRQLMKDHFVRPFPFQTSMTHLIHCEIFAAQDICAFVFLCAMKIWDAHSSQFSVEVLDGETIVPGHKARHLKR